MWDLIVDTAYVFAAIAMPWLLVWLYGADEPVGAALKWPRRPSTYCPGLPRMCPPTSRAEAVALR